MIMSAEALLARNPDPTVEDVNEAISGNVCRCTGYAPIVSAILDGARRRRTRAAAVTVSAQLHDPVSTAALPTEATS
jgi:carbon-monoxide dehydrogenase small subunit